MMPDHTAPADLVATLGPTASYLVVVDFDGTLAPIVDRPELAQAAPGAAEALTALARHTTVAALSGRPLEELLERLPGDVLLLVGGHGSQIRGLDGEQEHLVDVDGLTEALDRAEQDVLAAVGDGGGWLVERKLASLAVHHRLVPEDEEAALLPRVSALLDARRQDGPGFDVLQGKAIIELRPSGVDKGLALRWMMEQHPGLVPLVFGDDHTDEDAFEVAVEANGRAVIVGDDPRPTHATDRLKDPTEVVETLAALAEGSGGE